MIQLFGLLPPVIIEREAYEANQFIIDRIKLEVPMWKKTLYIEETKWIACHRCLAHGEHAS